MDTIDKNLVALRFQRSSKTYEDAALVQRDMAKELLSLLPEAEKTRRYERIFEVGCGTGILTRLLAENLDYGELILNDLLTESARLTSELPRASFIHGDAENLSYPERLDMIAANAVLQWFADPAPFFRRSARVLKPGGILLFSVFGEKNLAELREIAHKGLSGWRKEALEECLAPDFELVGYREEFKEMAFASPLAVLKHIKYTGVGAASGSPLRWTRGRIADFEKRYRERFGRPAGGVTLTYHPILAAARRRSES